MLATAPARVTQQTQKHPATYLPRDEDLVVSLYVKARPGSYFVGYGLQQALQTAGLHFGEIDIFQIAMNMKIQGHILFSVASAVEPGDFDTRKDGGFRTTRLQYIYDTVTCADPKKALIILLILSATGRRFRRRNSHDNHHQPFTENSIANIDRG